MSTPPEFRAVDITAPRGEWQMSPVQSFAVYKLCPCNKMYAILGFVRQLSAHPETWAAYRSEIFAEVLLDTFGEPNARQQAFDAVKSI